MQFKNLELLTATLLVLVLISTSAVTLATASAIIDPRIKNTVLTNRPSVAIAVEPPSVDGGTLVTLDGGSSTDSDGTIASYNWIQTSGTLPLTLQGANTARATLTAPSVTAYTKLTFVLVVTDNNNAVSKPSTVSVLVKRVNTTEGGDGIAH
jgi:hypothetical protein